MSSKGSKRRVTVDTKNCEDKDKRKPSVFERLGAGSSEICLSDLQDREVGEKIFHFYFYLRTMVQYDIYYTNIKKDIV